ncbi:MAG: hypothetical protein LKM36_04290 [Flavobacteriales bacterium]|jgi:hypothetical protein|nr:hypothetical protein [Flavobacteriales bacterium]MCI1752100.1 hypothetical protein [Flavobacteriales bacterium]
MRVERLYPMVKPATFVRLRLFGVIGGVLFAVLAWSQLSAPQSVVFDVLGDRYFVACPGNDQIMQRAQDGAISTFVYVHDTPLGLDMKGDTLFACVGSFVEAYSASNATTLFAYDVKGGFLKGVSSDGTFLYVSDMLGKRIVRIDPISRTSMDWVPNLDRVPQAVQVDAQRGLLWVTFLGEFAPVCAFDLNTAALVYSIPTALTDVVGLALDCSKKVVIASRNPGRVSRFDPDATSPELEDLRVDGVACPGDIDYDSGHGRICVPDPLAGTLVFNVPNGCAEDVFKRIDYKTVQVFPEPKTNLLCVDLATGETERFVLFSSTGLLVASGELRPQACLDLKKLGKGDFFVEIPRLKQYLKFTIPESPERINRNRVASAGKR